ncbi:hypothetical protein HAX54_004502 [Datura stramonium]|uniref:Uncharacterized protein n=1 Tax=Datura stramonium TaxID=4076 RepID=A0ABS8T728_DATST|nr:hypothetical protein [Datura stramonium]
MMATPTAISNKFFDLLGPQVPARVVPVRAEDARMQELPEVFPAATACWKKNDRELIVVMGVECIPLSILLDKAKSCFWKASLAAADENITIVVFWPNFRVIIGPYLENGPPGGGGGSSNFFLLQRRRPWIKLQATITTPQPKMLK